MSETHVTILLRPLLFVFLWNARDRFLGRQTILPHSPSSSSCTSLGLVRKRKMKFWWETVPSPLPTKTSPGRNATLITETLFDSNVTAISYLRLLTLDCHHTKLSCWNVRKLFATHESNKRAKLFQPAPIPNLFLFAVCPLKVLVKYFTPWQILIKNFAGAQKQNAAPPRILQDDDNDVDANDGEVENFFTAEESKQCLWNALRCSVPEGDGFYIYEAFRPPPSRVLWLKRSNGNKVSFPRLERIPWMLRWIRSNSQNGKHSWSLFCYEVVE